MTKKLFMKKAKEVGLKVHKNNIFRAKPLNRICGSLKAKYPTSVEKLLACY